MKILKLILAITVLLWVITSTTTQAIANDKLPIVTEHVDEIMIVYTGEQYYARLLFIRVPDTPGSSELLATRLHLEEMIWSVNQYGQFVLMWRDYWTCHRVITTDCVTTICVPRDLSQDENQGQWWAMGRNMKDLKSP